MKNMNINDKKEQVTKMDAFEASLNPRGAAVTASYKTKPTILGTKTITTITSATTTGTTTNTNTPQTPPTTNNNNTNINKQIPPPIPAKKPAQFSSKPIINNNNYNTSDNKNNNDKVNISKSLYNQQQTLCGNCNKPVSTRIMVTALGKRWHNGCFQCTTCHIPLDKVEFFEKDGQPYCEEDYQQLFNHICDYCKQIITEVK